MELQNKGTLLIADDEADLVEIYVDLLSPIAHQIVIAKNGAEALNYVRSGRIHAALTDVSMPVMTGLEFLAEVRKMGLQLPVVVVTGFGDKQLLLEAIRLNATDFVEKPFNASQFTTTVKKALDYGLALSELENAIDLAFANTALPAEEVQRIKKIRKLTAALKAGTSIYLSDRKKVV